MNKHDNSLCWEGEFPSSYIEDLTRKAGNYKKMNVFTTMLTSNSENTNIGKEGGGGGAAE